MAGIAALRKEPVQVCNLQKDESGVVKPSAKETKVEGSITVPLLAEGNLRGTLGIAKPVVYEFTQDEVDFLLKLGSLIAAHLKAN
jgi:putative methionine-R-sulfoxide reductase with GAF domain